MGEKYDQLYSEVIDLEAKAKELKRKSEDPSLHQYQRDQYYWDYKALMEEIDDKRYYLDMHAAELLNQ